MSTYYKYAEQKADSQVNWAEVGKGISDMLKQETEIREKKKADIDEATRKDMLELQNAPQGQFQDGNTFINNYAHSVMEQQMIDNRLLKAGQMKPQDYTLRRQNYKDGTNTLFELQKLYQENYKTRMEGIQSGRLQALTGANMASIEGFADFSKSRAIIDPATGIVNVGIMRRNPETGVMELTQDVVPVNVLKGKILAEIPAWDADGAINSTVKNMGDIKTFVYSAATKTKDGTIKTLLGLPAISSELKANPELKGIVDDANKAINSTIDSYFANDYNITSVLTQNTNKYGQESFTYSKDEAAKDPSKILLKINPNTQLPIIDKSGTHYKKQEDEAREWVKNQLISKMDNEKSMTTTGTTPYGPQPTAFDKQTAQEKQNSINIARQIGGLWGGDATTINASAAFVRDLNPAISDVTRNANGVTVTYTNAATNKVEQKNIPFRGPNGRNLTQQEFIKAAGPLLTGNPNLADAVDEGGFIKNATFNPSANVSSKAVRVQQPGTAGANPFSLGGYTPAAGSAVGVGSKYN